MTGELPDGNVSNTLTLGSSSDIADGLIVNADLANNTLDFTKIADAMTLYANLTIASSPSNFSLNVDSNTFFVDTANNRVGVGTAVPSTKLHVAGGAAVDADQNLSLEGAPASGDTYMKFNSAKNYLSIFVNGFEVARLKE